MNIRAAQKINYCQSARVTLVPANFIFYSTLFYTYLFIYIYHKETCFLVQYFKPIHLSKKFNETHDVNE